MRILLVEDEESIRGFIKINLIRNGFEVIEAGSGEAGINKALNEKPDMAILDVMLPGIDGFQVCSILRNEYPKIGIIMLTAKGQDMDKIMGLEYGADDYIVKPFNPLEVVLRVKAILRRMETKDEKINKDEILKNMQRIYSNIFAKTFVIYPILSLVIVMCYPNGGIWNNINSALSNNKLMIISQLIVYHRLEIM